MNHGKVKDEKTP